MEREEKITGHFEQIAGDYLKYKEMNKYYYRALKELVSSKFGRISRVLEIGCGTGDIIGFLNPKEGVGVDVSRKMIELASKHYPQKNLSFCVSAGESLDVKGKFDGVLMVDVIEHLSDVRTTASEIRRVTKKGALVFISSANPLWEPILLAAEKLGFKMPEGPHNWISKEKLRKIFEGNGFVVVEEGFRLAVPKKVPLADQINAVFWRVPLLRNLGLIQFLLLQRGA